MLIRSLGLPDAATAILSQAEAQRLAQERAVQKQREEQAQREAEAQRMAELKAMEEQLARNQMQLQEKMPTLLQCQDWDQVAQLVLQVPAQSAATTDDKQEAALRAVVKATPKVDPKKVAQAFKEKNGDIDATLLVLHAIEFNEAFQNMLAVFPDLPRDQVQEILMSAFPDSGKAMQELQPVSNDLTEERLLRQSIQNETRFLADSKKALADWEAEKNQITQRRAERKRHVVEAKTPEEKGFMQMVDEMQTQKEDIDIKQNDEKLKLDVATRESKISALHDQLDALLNRRHAKESKQPGSSASLESDIKRRKAEFDRLLALENQALESQQSDAAARRQSVVARRLREQFGDVKFMELQQAIGRAPGGFSHPPISPRAHDALAGIIAAQAKSRASLSSPNLSQISAALPASANAAPQQAPFVPQPSAPLVQPQPQYQPQGSMIPRAQSYPQTVPLQPQYQVQQLQQAQPHPQPLQQQQQPSAPLPQATNPFAPASSSSNPFIPSYVPDRPVFAPSAPSGPAPSPSWANPNSSSTVNQLGQGMASVNLSHPGTASQHPAHTGPFAPQGVGSYQVQHPMTGSTIPQAQSFVYPSYHPVQQQQVYPPQMPGAYQVPNSQYRPQQPVQQIQPGQQVYYYPQQYPGYNPQPAVPYGTYSAQQPPAPK